MTQMPGTCKRTWMRMVDFGFGFGCTYPPPSELGISKRARWYAFLGLEIDEVAVRMGILCGPSPTSYSPSFSLDRTAHVTETTSPLVSDTPAQVSAPLTRCYVVVVVLLARVSYGREDLSHA
jgi:hypothetical protein